MTAALSRRKRVVFAAVTVLVSLAVTCGALALADVLVRRHYAPTLGLNRSGYRGRLVGAKQPGERRVVMLGGSTTFGFGVRPTETIAAELQRRLGVIVVNLGYPKEAAWSFRPPCAGSSS